MTADLTNSITANILSDLRAGRDQREILETLRDELATKLSMSPLAAANAARLFWALAIKQAGLGDLYSADDLRTIHRNATAA